MSPAWPRERLVCISFPRPRGDEPTDRYLIVDRQRFSPPARG